MSGTNTLAIPASAVVSVTPSVISAGGNALDLSGVILSNNPRTPIGSVLSFPSQSAVASFYGPSSQKAALATNYFLGFDNSNQKPGALLIAQYNQASVGAWLLGGSVSGLSLAQIQALSGVLAVTIDGTLRTSSAINLSSATSFSNAAELISTALGVTGPAGASFTGAILGSVLTAGAPTGTLAVGQEVRGAGIATGTLIASLGSGTGGAGTYNLTGTQTVTSEAMTTNQPVVTYDSIAGAFYVISPTTGAASTIGFGSGTISTGLALTQATGATTSQGAIAAVPATFMANLASLTQNWACFTTSFDPDNGSGNTQKLAFSTWTNGTVGRYVYVGWDTDITPTLSTNATASFGSIVNTLKLNGTIPVYSPAQGPVIAAFLMGAISSIDFTQTEGRINLKFRAQTGLAFDVTSQTVSANLEANGYNYYGAWATANQGFVFLSPGQIGGPFKWIDSYVDEIWLNNQFQLALMVFMTGVNSVPYNQQGYGGIRGAMLDPALQALNFGAIRPGITLSQSQISQINTSAGLNIDTTLATQGWYLQVKDATPQVRAARGSPPITFWYTDGGSVNKLNISSVEAQ